MVLYILFLVNLFIQHYVIFRRICFKFLKMQKLLLGNTDIKIYTFTDMISDCNHMFKKLLHIFYSILYKTEGQSLFVARTYKQYNTFRQIKMIEWCFVIYSQIIVRSCFVIVFIYKTKYFDTHYRLQINAIFDSLIIHLNFVV